MSKILNTYLLTSMVVMFSLSLSACDNNEKEKPDVGIQTSTQVVQPVDPARPTTSSIAPSILSETEATTSDSYKTEDFVSESRPAPVTQQQSLEKMLALARKSGCLACHSIDIKVVGPA